MTCSTPPHQRSLTNHHFCPWCPRQLQEQNTEADGRSLLAAQKLEERNGIVADFTNTKPWILDEPTEEGEKIGLEAR